MKAKTKTMSMIAIIALAMLLLSSAFSGISTNPFLSKQPNPEDPGGFPVLPLPPLDINNPSDDEGILFRVINQDEGPIGLAYLRTAVHVTYSMGNWDRFTDEPRAYINSTTIDVDGSSSVTLIPHSMYIRPLKAISSSLPIAKDTSKVTLEEDLNMSYDQEAQIMNIQGEIVSGYLVDFYLPLDDDDYLVALRAAGTTPEDRYLEIPSAISSKLVELASLITKDVDSSYDKAMAIAEFLRNNYDYNVNFSMPPTEIDSLEWFLFNNEDKGGIHTHFNTAFVMLARSLNIPARLCSGYLIDPAAPEQDITAGMTHTYAEIRLDGIGWVLLDAAPQPKEDDETPPEDDGTSISGHVFFDRNNNMFMDDEDIPLSDCTVELLDNNDEVVMSDRTDYSGAYSFAPVAPGEYWIKVSPREGWELVNPDPEYVDMNDHPVVRDFRVEPNDDERFVDTITDITQWEEIVGKRSGFYVNGTVMDEMGEGVSGLSVEIYLAENKTTKDKVRIGHTVVQNGIYSAFCEVPDDLKLGNFQLIAKTIGGAMNGVIYAPSDSDPVITVTDDSEIQIDGPSRAITGRDATFSVTSDRPVEGAQVEISVGGHKETYTTGSNGAFNFTLPCDTARTVRILATYQGSENLGPTSVSIDLEVLSPTIDATVDDLVRGENNVITGRIHAGDLPVDDEEVILHLSNGLEARGTTDSEGRFRISLEVPRSTKLGEVLAEIEMRATVHETYEAIVKARTTLKTSLDGDTVMAVLTDDLGEPLGGQEIDFYYGTSRETIMTNDSNGIAWYAMGTGWNAIINSTYNGNSLYLPSNTSLEIPSLPAESWPWKFLLPLLIAPAAVLGALFYRKRSTSPPPTGPTATVTSLPPIVQASPIPSPYVLSLPQIASPLPDIWGEGDPLLMDVRGPDGSVAVSVDGENIDILELRQGSAQLNLDLRTGGHIIGVMGASGSGERSVRIVKYRDEVIRQYREALESWRATWPDLNDDLTPREIAHVLEDRVGLEGAEGLARSTSLFERAHYSTHPVTRKDFEDMYHALGKVNM